MRLLVLLLVAFPALAGDPARGKEVVLSRGEGSCLLCHAVPGAIGRTAGDLGPSLAGIGSRMKADELRLRIADASKFKPDTVMPPYGRVEALHQVAPQYRGKPLLTPEEIEDAVAYLLTLR